MGNYVKGTLVRLTASFVDPLTNAAVDPTGITVQIIDPDATTTTYTSGSSIQLVQDSPGHYHVDINANLAGIWFYRWNATGTYQAADEGYFDVQATRF